MSYDPSVVAPPIHGQVDGSNATDGGYAYKPATPSPDSGDGITKSGSGNFTLTLAGPTVSSQSVAMAWRSAGAAGAPTGNNARPSNSQAADAPKDGPTIPHKTWNLLLCTPASKRVPRSFLARRDGSRRWRSFTRCLRTKKLDWRKRKAAIEMAKAEIVKRSARLRSETEGRNGKQKVTSVPPPNPSKPGSRPAPSPTPPA